MSENYLKLATCWESLRAVRRRFRIGAGAEWIHIPVTADGEEQLHSNPGLKANYMILRSIVEAVGIDKIPVRAFEKQVPLMQHHAFGILIL